MKDQYVGDISDLLKYHFIRSVACGRRIGMAWYYVPDHDGRPDGQHIEWQSCAAHHTIDPEVSSGLKQLAERTVAIVENASFWPTGTMFHREPVAIGRGRRAWADSMNNALQGSGFVFCDPDNGLGASPKHVHFDELHQLMTGDRVVSFITFPKRVPHIQQVADLHRDLHRETGASSILTIRTSVSVQGKNGKQPRARWFTLLNPDAQMVAASQQFADRLQAALGAKVAWHSSEL